MGGCVGGCVCVFVWCVCGVFGCVWCVCGVWVCGVYGCVWVCGVRGCVLCMWVSVVGWVGVGVCGGAWGVVV